MSGAREPPRITTTGPVPVEGVFDICDETGRVLASVPLLATDDRRSITAALKAALDDLSSGIRDRVAPDAAKPKIEVD